jgi:hypothetical protein
MGQGRSDGVSRVSNAYGPIAQGGTKEKIYTRHFWKNCQKQEKHKFLKFCLRAHETLATALIWGGNFIFDGSRNFF